MRTISFALNISLDGYCDHTLGNPSEELMDYFTGLMDDVDLIFYGRIMYEMMFPYWADVARDRSGTPAENRFADRLCAINNIVASKTLTTTGSDKTRIIHDDPIAALRQLKQQPGKKISVDTVSLLPQLIAANIIDEFHLVIHPVIAGKGRHLLPGGSLSETLSLKLVDTKTFDNGCIALHYTR